jgi:hypothetical protein
MIAFRAARRGSPSAHGACAPSPKAPRVDSDDRRGSRASTDGQPESRRICRAGMVGLQVEAYERSHRGTAKERQFLFIGTATPEAAISKLKASAGRLHRAVGRFVSTNGSIRRKTT